MFVPFEYGITYIRQKDLHQPFGGSKQSGISPSAKSPFIFLFTGTSGGEYGYSDAWEDDGRVFLYTGEGQVGDMEFRVGNKAIRDHLKNGKQLLLFEGDGRGNATYKGEFVCIGTRAGSGPDREGNVRQTIVFELRPILDEATHDDHTTEMTADVSSDVGAGPWGLPLCDLRARVLANAPEDTQQTVKHMRRRYYERSLEAAVYVRRRANGVCEGCGHQAPFTTSKGEPFLEAHHIRRKADQGPDHPAWMVAICPNCHRRVHLGIDGAEYNAHLLSVAQKIEFS